MTGVLVLSYVVPGRPVSWQRKTPALIRGKVRVLTSKAQRAAKQAHQLAAIAAMRGRRGHVLEGDFAMQIDAYYPDKRMGDADRVAGLPMDACEGIAYRVDRQVRKLSIELHVDKAQPRVVVTIWRVG
jgi:hypothetical protein